MPVDIFIKQIAILALVAMAGVIGSWTRVITTEVKDFVARLIFNITLPAMLFGNFSTLELTPRLLSNSFQILGLAAFVLAFMLAVGWITSSFIGISEDDKPVFRLHSMLGNTIYLGFPVIFTIFGREGLLYASLFTLVSNISMWIIGVMILTNGKKMPVRERVMHILNPNTIAIVAGFILFLSGVKLPGVLKDAVTGLGSTTTYLSMIYIGAVLWYAGVKTFIGKRSIYILALNRLLLVPLMLIAFFYLLVNNTPIKFDTLVLSVVILEAAMPCMVNVVIMVKILGKNDTLAVANVFVTTLLSIITMPLILICLGFLTG
ncbi:MAG TPA: AEC family transporter [Bacteroidales bacterium]|mgnify:CR=1 FL=1|nr:AEC family transporter [Bacteroidales bacterium]HRR94438.1 AEC family transporter [Bacteroidales bacterium]